MMSNALWTLIVIQMVMGAFDTLYHHELTERLAWRPSQRRELALHGVRNVLYAIMFPVLGWFIVTGPWAILLIALLATELLITLIDFVEEDLSRKLPASERINHTLLTLNYGAILALLMPLLLDWAKEDAGIVPTSYGLVSLLMIVAAAGVILFGIRDLLAAARLNRLARSDAAGLVAALPARRHVLVTGATGFVGRRLVEALTSAGHQVTVLTRDAAKTNALEPPFTLVTRLDQIADDRRIDTIVNLAGEPVAGGLWTARRRRRILRSRLVMVRDLVGLMGRLQVRPTLLINASAVGWYGLWDDEPLTETSASRPCFTQRVCTMTEAAARGAGSTATRVVLLRTGLVLGSEGGLLGQMLAPFEFGLGGPIGSGRQWMSWIERDDLVRLIAHVMATPTLDGPVNATAPTPSTNADFAKELGRALGRPAFLRLPAAVLRTAGDFADELLLGGQRVLPEKALMSGFHFRYETLAQALPSIVGAKPRPRAGPAQPRAVGNASP